MFLPLGDAPNESASRPWVNYGLIAVNVAVYLWATATHPGPEYSAWVQEWGFVPVAPRLETFFTSMFMHGGFAHLGGNMLYLWIFGDNAEGRLGHLGYLFMYLACGLGAVLLFRVLGPHSTVPLVGASGAIFGVLGFYWLAFPRNRVRVVYWILIIGWLWVPARVVLGLYFVLNLISTLSAWGKAGGGVAYAAHVGGFVCGLLIAWGLHATRPRAEVLERAAGHGPGPASTLLSEARLALSAGDYTTAQAALETVVRKHVYDPEAPEAALQLGLLYARGLGRPEAAREYLSFAARLHPDPRGRMEAAAELNRLT